MEIFKLFGSVFVDTKDANKSLDDIDKKAQGFGGKLGAMVGTAAKWGVGLAAGAATAVGGMVALATKTAETADAIDKLSERTGINREELQRWRYAAGQSGADVNKLTVGIKTMSDTMVSAMEGNEAASNAFSQLGVALTDANGKARSTEEVFHDVMFALAGMEEGAQRNALGNDILGKSYTEMLPLLNEGQAGMQGLMQRADELGLVMSEDAVKANVAFKDSMDDLKQSFGMIFAQISTAFLPILQQLIDFIMLHMPEIQAVIQTVFGVIEEIAGFFIEIVQNIIDTINNWFANNTESAQQFQDFFTGLGQTLGEIFNLIVQIVQIALENIMLFWQQYGDQIMAIVGPLWDGIKVVIETAMNIIRDVLNLILSLIKGDWKGAWEAVKQILIDVWEGIKGLVPSLLNSLYEAFKLSYTMLKDIGREMFNRVWDGMKGIWNSIYNWVSDKVSWLIDKLAFWRKSNDSMKTTTKKTTTINGSHANGLDYVPFDGYIAELHRGERVLTAEENKALARPSVNNYFTIQQMNVRNDSDIKLIAQELNKYINVNNRALGVT